MMSTIFKPIQSDHPAAGAGVRFRTKIAYGLGAVVFTGGMAVDQLTSLIFVVTLGLSPALVGWAPAIFRIWDGIIDPVMGNISDNCRSRFGRRKPFLYVGTVACAIAFPLIWIVPPHWNDWAIFAWFIATGILYYTCSTIFLIPYLSLAWEMSSDDQERTRIIAYRTFFIKIAFIAVGWIFMITRLDFFETEMKGAIVVSLIISTTYLVFGFFAARTAEERFKEVAAERDKVPLFKGLKIAMKSGPFLITVIVVCLLVIGTYMVNALGNYLNIYYVFAGDADAASVVIGWANTANMLSAIASIPVFTWLAGKYGKVNALYVNCAFLVVAYISTLFLLHPDYPYLQIIINVLTGPGYTGIFIIIPAMQADVCDLDELETGNRQEGLFNSVYSWFYKLSFSIAVVLSGYIATGAGFDPDLVQQTPQALFLMRVLYATVPIAAILVMIWFLSRYPLTEEHMKGVRRQLEERRGVV